MGYAPIDIERSVVRECSRRRYSPRTAETYLACINKFISWTNKTIDKIGKSDAREFLSYLDSRGLAGSSLNVYHMAIRFLLEEILHKRMKLNIRYSRIRKTLPVYLTKDETKALLSRIGNWKHRLMVEVMYGGGLRVSELLNLRVGDLEIDKGYGYIRCGKGGKDRLFVLPEIVREKIRNLIGIDKLNEESYLFLNNRKGRYSIRSVQEIVKRAGKSAGIGKKIHPHTLRHSFATHLIENGNSVSEVQALLGHKSPETTMIYVHMASPNLIKVKSPLDGLR